MKEPNRERKNEINYSIQLNEEQKQAKRLIIENQIVIITGLAGTGKSLVAAQTALDFLFKKQIEHIYITRATIEVGKSLGFLPGNLGEKFDPYIDAIKENFYKCRDAREIDQIIEKGIIRSTPIQFIRGKTIDELLIVEEAQNVTPREMEAILTRLGKTGKIILTGDNSQQDTNIDRTGLSMAIDLSKRIDEIKWIKLKENHRSPLVSKILDVLYGK